MSCKSSLSLIKTDAAERLSGPFSVARRPLSSREAGLFHLAHLEFWKRMFLIYLKLLSNTELRLWAIPYGIAQKPRIGTKASGSAGNGEHRSIISPDNAEEADLAAGQFVPAQFILLLTLLLFKVSSSRNGTAEYKLKPYYRSFQGIFWRLFKKNPTAYISGPGLTNRLVFRQRFEFFTHAKSKCQRLSCAKYISRAVPWMLLIIILC